MSDPSLFGPTVSETSILLKIKDLLETSKAFGVPRAFDLYLVNY
jgi:hypothetical protein